jgi:hypothetical protein
MACEASPLAAAVLSQLRLRTPVHPFVLANAAGLFLLVDRGCEKALVNGRFLRFSPIRAGWWKRVAELSAAQLLLRHGCEDAGTVALLAALACGDERLDLL